MPEVHPSSILNGDVQLAHDVVVGPSCVLEGPITIGAGTRLIGNVYLHGPLTMGTCNTVYPFACLGLAPQHQAFDPRTSGCGLVIGNDNTFREYVTINRAFTDQGPTTVGDRNWFMTNSHAGHDCRIGNDCAFVNHTLLAGHVTVGDHVVMGGRTGAHQFCRIGRGAMVQGTTTMNMDLAPHFMLTGPNICGAVNRVGMRRRGMTRDEMETVKWVFKTIYRRELTFAQALETLRERAGDPLVAEYVQFIEQSKRGLCPGVGRARHGTAAAT